MMPIRNCAIWQFTSSLGFWFWMCSTKIHSTTNLTASAQRPARSTKRHTTCGAAELGGEKSRAPSRPHKQGEVAAGGAQLILLRREAQRAHGGRVPGERVQQRARVQVEHVHVVVGAAREEHVARDGVDGERVEGVGRGGGSL